MLWKGCSQMTTRNPPALTDAQIAEALKPLVGWKRDGDQITKTYKLDNYMDGLAFASAVGTIAQGLDHHPDILIGYKKVTVTYSTHSVGNKITQNDIEAATAIEALPFKPASA
jgi:4a-hydroxytetrahydrobiopterin dehydratase